MLPKLKIQNLKLICASQMYKSQMYIRSLYLLLCPISIQHNKRIIDHFHKFWVLIGWAGKLIYIWDLGILQQAVPNLICAFGIWVACIINTFNGIINYS